MLVVTYVSFIFLTALAAVTQWYAWRAARQKEGASTGNNPIFLAFQRRYYAAYLLALVADWLQAPYLYKLYRSYGFTLEQISIIYVCGFITALASGALIPFVVSSKHVGRRFLCAVCTLVYAVSCLLKLSTSYMVLLLGRILGGASASILFHACEAWYVQEHSSAERDFPSEWIGVTFRKVGVWNGVLAVGAGLVANAVSEWFQFGPVAPSILAAPFALMSGMAIMSAWNENYGTSTVKFRAACVTGLREIGDSRRVLLIGAVQALFESVNCIFIFLWTPMLDVSGAIGSHYARPSLGIVFSCFMMCTLVGSGVHHLLEARRVRLPLQMAIAITLAFLSNLACIFSSGDGLLYTYKRLNLLAFFVFEIAIGLYFPTMSKLREQVIPEGHTAAIMSWFRVPLNILASAILIYLHGHHSGFYLIFVICAIQMLCALLCMVRFASLHQTTMESLASEPTTC